MFPVRWLGLLLLTGLLTLAPAAGLAAAVRFAEAEVETTAPEATAAQPAVRAATRAERQSLGRGIAEPGRPDDRPVGDAHPTRPTTRLHLLHCVWRE